MPTESTTTPALIQVEWRRRDVPLVPSAVAARGDSARALGRRLVARGDSDGLTAVVADDLIVITGPGDHLPWSNGVLYLGIDPVAPFLLMPTTLVPSVPADLLERALRMRFGAQVLAVLPQHRLVVPLGNAREIALDLLSAWIDAQYERSTSVEEPRR